MFSKLCAVAVLLTVVPFAQFADAENIAGRWHGSLVGHKIEVDVNQNGDQVNGAAKLYDPFGKKDVYHFKGAINGNQVSGAHTSGHRFDGVLTPQGTISGVLTTKGGQRANVELRR